MLLSLDMSWTDVPADRPILAPPPGRISTAWTTVPVGMLRSGRALPGPNVCPGARLEHVADGKAHRRQDVALLAVDVVEQGDAGVAVRVVLDGGDLGGHAVLGAPEVDDAVAPLVATTTVTRGDATVGVAARRALLLVEQLLLRLRLRDGVEVGDGLEAATR